MGLSPSLELDLVVVDDFARFFNCSGAFEDANKSSNGRLRFTVTGGGDDKQDGEEGNDDLVRLP